MSITPRNDGIGNQFNPKILPPENVAPNPRAYNVPVDNKKLSLEQHAGRLIDSGIGVFNRDVYGDGARWNGRLNDGTVEAMNAFVSNVRDSIEIEINKHPGSFPKALLAEKVASLEARCKTNGQVDIQKYYALCRALKLAFEGANINFAAMTPTDQAYFTFIHQGLLELNRIASYEVLDKGEFQSKTLAPFKDMMKANVAMMTALKADFKGADRVNHLKAAKDQLNAVTGFVKKHEKALIQLAGDKWSSHGAEAVKNMQAALAEAQGAMAVLIEKDPADLANKDAINLHTAKLHQAVRAFMEHFSEISDVIEKNEFTLAHQASPGWWDIFRPFVLLPVVVLGALAAVVGGISLGGPGVVTNEIPLLAGVTGGGGLAALGSLWMWAKSSSRADKKAEVEKIHEDFRLFNAFVKESIREMVGGDIRHTLDKVITDPKKAAELAEFSNQVRSAPDQAARLFGLNDDFKNSELVTAFLKEGGAGQYNANVAHIAELLNVYTHLKPEGSEEAKASLDKVFYLLNGLSFNDLQAVLFNKPELGAELVKHIFTSDNQVAINRMALYLNLEVTRNVGGHAFNPLLNDLLAKIGEPLKRTINDIIIRQPLMQHLNDYVTGVNLSVSTNSNEWHQMIGDMYHVQAAQRPALHAFIQGIADVNKRSQVMAGMSATDFVTYTNEHHEAADLQNIAGALAFLSNDPATQSRAVEALNGIVAGVDGITHAAGILSNPAFKNDKRAAILALMNPAHAVGILAEPQFNSGMRVAILAAMAADRCNAILTHGAMPAATEAGILANAAFNGNRVAILAAMAADRAAGILAANGADGVAIFNAGAQVAILNAMAVDVAGQARAAGILAAMAADRAAGILAANGADGVAIFNVGAQTAILAAMAADRAAGILADGAIAANQVAILNAMAVDAAGQARAAGILAAMPVATAAGILAANGADGAAIFNVGAQAAILAAMAADRAAGILADGAIAANQVAILNAMAADRAAGILADGALNGTRVAILANAGMAADRRNAILAHAAMPVATAAGILADPAIAANQVAILNAMPVARAAGILADPQMDGDRGDVFTAMAMDAAGMARVVRILADGAFDATRIAILAAMIPDRRNAILAHAAMPVATAVGILADPAIAANQVAILAGMAEDRRNEINLILNP